jgi:hypothetical protein
VDGHVLRMNKERIPKKALNMTVKGKCPKGRLKSRWGQQVRKDVTWSEGRPFEETEEELWEDSDKWRGLVVR